MTSREAILTRVRAVTGAVPPPPRDARPDQGGRPVPLGPAALVDLLAENLADYRARVVRAPEPEVPAAVARLLAERAARSVAVPPGLPPEWLAATTGVDLCHDSHEHPLTARELDGVSSVVTGCRLAVASTGTIVLDAGETQGRRVLTLAPDHHVCVIRTSTQLVHSLSEALPRLTRTRPLTWISGPSATSDIELTRVEGVHGPRILDVILTS